MLNVVAPAFGIGEDHWFSHMHCVQKGLLTPGAQQICLHRHDHYAPARHKLTQFSSPAAYHAYMGRNRLPLQKFGKVTRQNARYGEFAHRVQKKSIVAVGISAGKNVSIVANFKLVAIQGVMMLYKSKFIGGKAIGFRVTYALDSRPNNAKINSTQAEAHERSPEPVAAVPVAIVHDVYRPPRSSQALQNGKGQAEEGAVSNDGVKIPRLAEHRPSAAALAAALHEPGKAKRRENVLPPYFFGRRQDFRTAKQLFRQSVRTGGKYVRKFTDRL